jgi:4-hydroxyphenylpyruvate dioxygenase
MGESDFQAVFNFREIRCFDIEGGDRRVGAMTSPCGRSASDQRALTTDRGLEYLSAYHGEGIQHIALGVNIYRSRRGNKPRRFQTVPDTYYEQVDTRLPGHGEDLKRLAADRILIDGAPTQGGGLLLQIFTQTVIGPIFFEIIQRRGNEGFGEGNFRALFESIELDQIRRGVLKA